MDRVQLAYELSHSEPAARSLGVGDLGLLRAVVACLSGEPLSGELPSFDGIPAGDPIRGVGARSLRKLVEDNVCPDANWEALSHWIGELVAAAERASQTSGRFKAGALKDLAMLEKALGNYLSMYVYAAMAAEERPDKAVLAILKIEAALLLGDLQAYEEAATQLRAIAARGDMSSAEEQLLRSTAPEILEPASSREGVLDP